MGRMIIDAATSLDGFWADARGCSVFSARELAGAGLSGKLPGTCGAVVMSRRTFELSEDTAWIGEAYAAQTPVFVVTDARPANGKSGFHFVEGYAAAFAQARKAAGERAVLVVGEASALKAAMHDGEADEIWLRMTSRTLGDGAPLFDDGVPVENYFVSEIDSTAEAVHMHLEKR
ncbi:riboflavin biosynthesis protein RibD [Novosphingobium sp. FGD1]|jgi:dihydrofolate reductase|uniref:Riboflavin biosynthesis protein RibD n=1 Tax=Novosphingobium silvae TaxID=2692619 RepID=A0A7X4K6U4_9SPHN|nr:riboflavin biosynthesis protein RibD [Novosphingobium silvae]MYL98376.1 riboflavin biosynthesis protein RibD [Novosphingobium silvae]